jgi:tetratricopeptide (TPR) repeat protein
MAKNKSNKEQAQPQAKSAVAVTPAQATLYGAAKLPALIIFLFTCLVYGNSVLNGYTMDDSIVLTENVFTKQGINGLNAIFTNDAFVGYFQEKKSLVAGGRYRPLSIATFAIEYELYGLKPAYSHAINVLLFGGLCVCIFLLLRYLLPQKKDLPFYVSVPFLCAVLFAAHPIHTEAVTNIKGRDEIMSMLFAILALWAAVAAVKEHKFSYVLLGAVALFLSLLSKENAITFFAIVPLTYYFFTNAKLKDYVLVIVVYIVPAALYFLFRSEYAASDLAQESNEILNNPFVGATFQERYATPVYSFLLYYFKLVFPHPLSHDYYFNQIPLIGFGTPKFIASAIATLALVSIALNQLLRKTTVSYALLFFFITFSVVSNILFSVGIIMNERFMFMPSLGFCLLLAAGFNYLAVTNRLKPIAVGVLAGIVLFLYAAKTYSRNMDWKDNLTLFKADVVNSPNSAKVQTSVGGDMIAEAEKQTDSLKRKEMLTEAMMHLTKSLQIYPENFNALLLMGNAQYSYYKNVDAALPFYRRIMELNRGGEFYAYQNAGNLLFNEKRYAEALPYLKTAIGIRPKEIVLALRTADAYLNTGKADSALMYAQFAYNSQPQNAEAVHKIGMVYGRGLNQIDNAITYLKKATELNPAEVVFWEDLGVAYGFKADYDNAIASFTRLLQINPNHAAAYFNLSISYGNKGDRAKAEESYRHAVELDPAYAAMRK